MRVHGTPGETPIARFEREERQALRPLGGRAPFRQLRELSRRVQNDACVDVDTNHCSVPWLLIGAAVTVTVGADQVRVHHAGIEVACDNRRLGRRERAVDRDHLHGIVPCRPELPGQDDMPRSLVVSAAVELLRPLAEYEQVAGGGW